jgi:NAD(P)-dependent dehydrogenase (short-subunit alcohol dehydrogenase family)
MGLVDGQVALVSGGSSGIGLAIAGRFAAEGAAGVVIGGRDEAKLERARDALGEAGSVPIVTHRGDISDPAQAAALIEAAVQSFGRLDAAVNCAAIVGPTKPLAEIGDEEWREVVGVNLDGAFYCLRAEIKAMTATGGSIVNVSSGAAVNPPPNLAAYSATKIALEALTRAAAGECVNDGIRINSVLPSTIRTDLLDAYVETPEGKRMVDGIPMARLGEPREVAEAVVWLCSSRSSYVTATELLVDGGSHSIRFG